MLTPSPEADTPDASVRAATGAIILASGGEGTQAGVAGMQLLIVDDHPLFREALASAITLAFPDAALLEADGIRGACEVLGRETGIDLILLDLSMQGVSGFDGLVTIRARFPRVPVLIVSGIEDPRIMREALQRGASGFVPKAVDKATLTRAISEVMNGALFTQGSVAEVANDPRVRAVYLGESVDE